jgi:HEAT repeat protein
MALTVCLGYWLTEQSTKARADLQQQLGDMKQEQAAADKRTQDSLTELKGEIVAQQGGLSTSVDNEHKAVENRLQQIQNKFDLAQSSVAELRTAIENLKSIVPSLQRHDQELNDSAQRLVQLESRAAAFDTAIVDMKKQLDQRPVPAAKPAAAPAVAAGTPPWMGLVQQLESANSGDRWVAVQSLGETRDPAVAEYILPRLKDVDIFVRMVAARVLGDLGSPKAIGALIEALNDQDAAVREASYLALCTVSKKSLPFDPHSEPVERAKKVKAWQEWWKKAQEEGAAQ